MNKKTDELNENKVIQELRRNLSSKQVEITMFIKALERFNSHYDSVQKECIDINKRTKKIEEMNETIVKSSSDGIFMDTCLDVISIWEVKASARFGLYLFGNKSKYADLYIDVESDERKVYVIYSLSMTIDKNEVWLDKDDVVKREIKIF